VRIVVAKAQDIDGNPIVDETVCFHAQQEAGLYRFGNTTNGDTLSDPEHLLGKGGEVNLGGSYVTDPEHEGTNGLCATTNDEGLAAIDVVNSTASAVDMTVRYEDEAIVRDHLVSFAGNIGSEIKKEEEAKAKAEKEAEQKAAEEKAAKEKAEAEEKAKAAEKAKAERELAAEKERVAREEAAEKTRIEREAAAEKRQGEKEKAKEEFEKRTAEEITKNDEKRAAEEAAEKSRREKEAAEEKARREAEVKRHEEEVAKLAKPLVAPLAGAITGKGHGRHKAHAAAKQKRKRGKTHKQK
jgi:hypothetical protein